MRIWRDSETSVKAAGRNHVAGIEWTVTNTTHLLQSRIRLFTYEPVISVHKDAYHIIGATVRFWRRILKHRGYTISLSSQRRIATSLSIFFEGVKCSL